MSPVGTQSRSRAKLLKEGKLNPCMQPLACAWPNTAEMRANSLNRDMFMEDRFLYSGGTDSLENFTAKFSASAPVVYKNPPPMGPEILYTTAAGEG